MPQKVSEPKLPRGLARLAFRAPIWLYRVGLGWVLGHRFLRLTHIGRKSGLPRQTVLEMVRYNPDSGECIVASGWGKKSDWYQNVTSNPRIKVQVGNKHFTAIAHQLAPDQAGHELLTYARRYRTAFRELVKFMGYRSDGSDEDILAIGKIIPMFAFSPVPKSIESNE